MTSMNCLEKKLILSTSILRSGPLDVRDCTSAGARRKEYPLSLRLLICAAWLAGFGCAAIAQTAAAKLPPAPVNMDFSQGNPGEALAGWHAPAAVAQVIPGTDCYRGKQCAVLHGAESGVGAMGQ